MAIALVRTSTALYYAAEDENYSNLQILRSSAGIQQTGNLKTCGNIILFFQIAVGK
jgi:hypothetical protein